MGRIAILTAIDNQLANIDGTGNYVNALKKHTAGFVDYTELAAHEFPATCLVTGESSYTPMTAEKYTSGDAIQANDGWLISVIGYVKADTQKQISTKMETLISDIIRAVLADHHLGLASYVHNIVLKRVNPYLDTKENIGIAEIVWAVKYDFDKENP